MFRDNPPIVFVKPIIWEKRQWHRPKHFEERPFVQVSIRMRWLFRLLNWVEQKKLEKEFLRREVRMQEEQKRLFTERHPVKTWTPRIK